MQMHDSLDLFAYSQTAIFVAAHVMCCYSDAPHYPLAHGFPMCVDWCRYFRSQMFSRDRIVTHVLCFEQIVARAQMVESF
jgi:hypothetical protein